MIKLKQGQIKKYREDMLAKQGGRCAFCGQECKKPCLDHAHMEPYKDKVRGVICNWCNISIGKLENARVRTGTSWGEFENSFFNVHNYIWNLLTDQHWSDFGYSNADWHPSKRKSQVTEFRKLNAKSQLSSLAWMLNKFESTLEFYPYSIKNATERVKLFKKLNQKT